MNNDKQTTHPGRITGQNPAGVPVPAEGRPTQIERPGRVSKQGTRNPWSHRWPWLLLPVLPLAAMAATYVAATILPPSYTSQASLLVSFGREYVFRPLVGPGETILPWRPETIVNSELEILNSGDLSRYVVTTVGPERLIGPAAAFSADGTPDPRAFEKAHLVVRSGLTLKAVKDSNVIHVQFRHSDPVVAEQSLRALLDRYLQRRVEIYRTQDVGFLEERVAAQQASLDAAVAELHEQRRRLGLLRYEDERATLRERETALVSERDRLQKAHVEAMGERRVLEPLRGAGGGDLPQIEARIAGTGAALDQVDRLIAEVRERLDLIEASRDKLERLAAKVEHEQKRLEQSRIRLDEAKLNAALDQSRLSNVRLIEGPQLPQRKDGLSLTIKLAVAGLAGLLGAVALILIAKGPQERGNEHVQSTGGREEPAGQGKSTRAAA